MEIGRGETKTLHKSNQVRKDTKQKDGDLKKIKDFQTLISKLSSFKKLIRKLDRLKEEKNFEQIKSIDLIKILRGTQYSTKIKRFFEFDQAFKMFKKWITKLQCSYPDCEDQATLAFLSKDGEPTIQ